MYKDKDKQKQANREAAKRHRDKGMTKGMTEQGMTRGMTEPVRTITDATGQVHTIDYEGRRKSYAVLKAWAEGKGTPRQQMLGQLAENYNKGLDLNSYLGVRV